MVLTFCVQALVSDTRSPNIKTAPPKQIITNSVTKGCVHEMPGKNCRKNPVKESEPRQKQMFLRLN
jgi:hypothetical protein